MEEFKKGDLILFDITNKQYTEDGFIVGDTLGCNDNEIILKEKIDLENFPSWNDFKGKSSLVKHGELGIILKMCGKPDKLIVSEILVDIPLPGGEIYNVYEVLIKNNQKRQVFGYNIKKTKKV